MAVADDLKDAAVRRQVFLLRYVESTARKIVKLLADADADLAEQVAARLARIQQRGYDLGPATTRRLDALRMAVAQQSAEIHAALQNRLTGELIDLASTMADYAAEDIVEAVAVDLSMLRPSPELLRASVTARPLQGRLLREWITDLDADNVRRIHQAVQLGVIEGQTGTDIIARVVEQTDLTKRKAGALTRTAINDVSTRAREMLYSENDDLIDAVEWVATLDGKTTPICQARDGKVFPIGKGPRPPAHPNCRSTTAPVLKSWDALARPGALNPERGPDNIDDLFRQQLAAQGFKPDAIAKIKRNTRASMNGQVAGDLTYGAWLRKQPRSFVEDVMGVQKAKLFLDGKLPVEKFVDMRSGQPFTLDQLRRREPAAWKRAAAA